MLRWTKERKVLLDQVMVLEGRLAIAEKEKDLGQQEIEIQKKLTMLAEREAQIYRDAFEREKDLTDRALKLAEQTKPKTIGNFALYGLLGLAVFLGGMALGGL